MHNMTELETEILTRVDLSELPCSWSSCDAPAKQWIFSICCAAMSSLLFTSKIQKTGKRMTSLYTAHTQTQCQAIENKALGSYYWSQA